MADINTQAEFDRVNKVYVSGVTEKQTKADRTAIGDLTVLMYCKNGVPREPKLLHVERLMREKGFKLGKAPKVAKKKVKPISKAKAKKDLKTLVGESSK